MSLHYLLDGYNILKQMAAFRDLPLEEGRCGLLRWIGDSRPQGSVNNQVTVVFDGHPDHVYPLFCYPSGDSPKSQEEIRVIFSDGCSADDKIKLIVEEDADRKNCVVVSDDKGIFLYARSLGAKVMSVAAFTSKGGKYISCSKGKYRARNPCLSSNSREAETGLSLSSQEKINKELIRIWLKEKK